MLETGDPAPAFELPAAVDGEIRRVELDERADGGVVLLVFYPADFSPVCTDELCSLRDMELFDLQRDVTILGVSSDSAFSHRSFADRYGLSFPLLSDSDGSVAAAYGVRAAHSLNGHRGLAKRAVFVVDGESTVRYAWSTDDPAELPDVAEVRAAIEAVSEDDAAVERYRVGYEWYGEGREAYDRGSEALAADDWLAAASAFDDAIDPLSDAVDAFDAARRYAEADRLIERASDANELATDYRNAAKWYAAAAERYGRGEDAAGDDYLADAERIASSIDDAAVADPDAIADSAVDAS